METWIMWGRTKRQKRHVARETQWAARPLAERLEERLVLSNSNVTGVWQGTLTQPSNSTYNTYNFDMDLVQTQTSVTGTDVIQIPGTAYIGELTLTGTVSGSTFTFQEQTFLIDDPHPGYYWLTKSGSLTVAANGDSMAGTWDSDSGDITLSQISNSPASIIPTNLGSDPTQGGAEFSDQVTYGPVGYDTGVALYWSSTPQFSGAMGGSFYSVAIAKGTAVDTYGPFNVPQSDLTPPQGANYALAVTDPEDVLGNFDPNESVLALPTTSTAAASVSATFSSTSQTVPLTALVTSTAGTVDEGTETFSILSGTTVIGSAVIVDVVNGTASASYVLPGATPAGTYTIQAAYNGTADFLGSTDTSHSLTVSPATTSTGANSTSTMFDTFSQTALLSATVTSPAGTVDAGAETFTILSGTTVIGSADTSIVANGTASVFYLLPAATPVGTYTIQAVYSGAADFVGSTDTSHSLTVSQATTSTHAASTSTAFSTASQTVTLSATVTSGYAPVDEGTETFSILSGTTVIGSAVTVNVGNGTDSASYILPGATPVGTYTVQAVYNGTTDFLGSSDTRHYLTVSQAGPFQLSIQVEPPSNATAGQVFSPSIVVDEDDQYGNIETDDNSSVITVTLGGGTGPLQGSLTETVVGGVATFTNLYDDTAGTITLEFSEGNLPTVTSSAIIVGPSDAAKLVVGQQPFSLTAGQNFGPVVDEVDQFGNVITGDSTSTVTVARGPVGTANVQGGNLTVTLVDGVATFSDLVYDTAETMDLVFSSNASGVSAVTSGKIVVTPAAATQLVIETEPSSTATAGEAFQTQPVIDETDKFGNLETSDDSTVVTVSLSSGIGPLQGRTLSIRVVGGVASFSGLGDNTAETIALEFSGDGMTSLPSAPIVVQPAAPFRLNIDTQPSPTAAAGVPLATQPVIEELDLYGNVETTDNSTAITAFVSFGNGPLVGTTTVVMSGGVATFTNLADTSIGTIALGFSGGGLAVGPSDEIVIDPGPATQLVIVSQPGVTVTAGNAFTRTITIDEEDRFGNLETTDNYTVVTATLNSSNGALQGVKSITLHAGSATFTKLEIDTAGTFELKFASGTLTPATSSAITVSPAPATQLVVTTPPPSLLAAGQTFTIAVAAEDPFNNVVTTFNGSVTVTLAGDPGLTRTVTAKNGVATFAGLSVSAGFQGGSIQATATGLRSAATAPISLTSNQNSTSSQPPTIIGEQPVTQQKKNSKGKLIGKPVLTGYRLDFSEAMNPATAGNAANYQITQAKNKRVRKTTVTAHQPVALTAAYNAPTNSVTLTLVGKPAFAEGGVLTVTYEPPAGVTSATGDFLAATPTAFTISPKGKRITAA
jgi:Bacterial Ig-like domain (group 3)